MIYLKNFIYPSEYTENKLLDDYYSGGVGCTYHENYYPFRILSGTGLNAKKLMSIGNRFNPTIRVLLRLRFRVQRHQKLKRLQGMLFHGRNS